MLTISLGQKSDPRTVALAGATTTIADGTEDGRNFEWNGSAWVVV